MKIYAPIYDHGKKIEALESTELKRLTGTSVCRYKKNVGFYGNIYHIDTLFKTAEDAIKYWSLEYAKPITSQEFNENCYLDK